MNEASGDLERYRAARQDFFSRHGYRWPSTLADAFDILDLYPLSDVEADEIRNATGRLAAIYQKTGNLLKNASSSTLLQLGIPEHLTESVRYEIAGLPDCVLGRFDFVPTATGYKMLEFNSDNPGFIVEAFSLNSAVCHDQRAADPNEGCETLLRDALESAVGAGLAHAGKSESDGATIVVAHGRRFGRDCTSAVYLCNLLRTFSPRHFPIESLQIDREGLYSPDGQRIDVLLRSYSLKFIRDELFNGAGNFTPESGGALLRLVESKKLALINPPAAFLLENKALQAVIWNLSENGLFFDDQERQWVKRHMLPTFLDQPDDGGAYIIKPVHGAEGDSVTVVNGKGEAVLRSATTTYSDEPAVYQKYVPVPQKHLMTEYGVRDLHLVLSCFVVAGNPSAICMRAGDAITNETAWVVPLRLQPHL